MGLCMGSADSNVDWCVASAVAVTPRDEQSTVAVGILAQEISELQRDKRGSSRILRPAKKTRPQCRWQEQYLGPSPVYSPLEFRQRFGVSLVVFREVMSAVRDCLTVRADATGKPGMTAELAVLFPLRRCRTGLGSEVLRRWLPIAPAPPLQPPLFPFTSWLDGNSTGGVEATGAGSPRLAAMHPSTAYCISSILHAFPRPFLFPLVCLTADGAVAAGVVAGVVAAPDTVTPPVLVGRAFCLFTRGVR